MDALSFLIGALYGMGCTFATYFWTLRKSMTIALALLAVVAVGLVVFDRAIRWAP